MKTDAQLQDEVHQALKKDPAVTHEHIGVCVENGIVTLSGFVPNYAEKLAAERTTRHLGEVQAVVSRIDVKLAQSQKRRDEDIAAAVLDQMRWNVQVPDGRIQIQVQDGWVDLLGRVDWMFQKDAAESCVRGLTGLRGISNLIVVNHETVDAEEVRAKILKMLNHEAENESRQLAIEVKGSKVTLSGKVHSFAEMDQIKWATWSVPGVSEVENKLNVEFF